MCEVLYLCLMFVGVCMIFFFFFKQKTAYEMRISDWSSDVCSSDLAGIFAHGPDAIGKLILETAARLNYYPAFVWAPVNPYILEGIKTLSYEIVAQIGRASCRERVCQYV